MWLAIGLSIASFAMLLVEMRRRERGGLVIATTGLLAVAALAAAVLRPARVSARESIVGARVVVLADASRSMALKQGGQARWEARDRAIEALAKAGANVRLSVLGFGEGPAAPLPLALSDRASEQTARAPRSDLGAAVRAIAASAEERPSAVVVVSDGRLDDPPEDASDASLQALAGSLRVPIDTVATTREPPADASVRRVSAAGAAVAHVPLPLRVEVGCAGGLTCDDVTVTARELRDDGPPALLASGIAHVKDGKAALDLTVTLDRAGARIVEVAIAPPPGDTIPDNDRRLVTFHVRRERVRVLHVAGRPTNDVRALRQWLKSDASVDVVAFFILRTPTDDVRATQNELALIPFPVDQLFTDQLPTFDAVVLQDFDAQPYGLEKYLPNVERYVRRGGGLVMVGGENSFVAGGYASTPLAARAARGARWLGRGDGRGHVALRAGVDARGPRGAAARAAARRRGRRAAADAGRERAGRSARGRRVALGAPDAQDQERRGDAGAGGGRPGRRAVRRARCRRCVAAGVLDARREDGGARARRAVGRPARVVDARPPVRARAARRGRRLHRGARVDAARAPDAGRSGRADRCGEGGARRDADRSARSRRPSTWSKRAQGTPRSSI